MSEKRKKILKVVVLGDIGVGKTSLIQRYTKDLCAETYRHTVGADVLVKKVNLGNTTEAIHIWDTDVRDAIQTYEIAFYRAADCCVLVFDVNNPGTFVSIDKWKSKFLKFASLRDPSSFPFILLGNKIDLMNDNKKQIISPVLRELWCTANNGTPFIETSARDNINVQHAFETIIGVTRERNLPKLFTRRISFASFFKRRSQRSSNPCLE